MNIHKRFFAIGVIAATESTRYPINGVQLRRDGDECVAEATDGRRMMQLRWKEPIRSPKRVDDFRTIIAAKDCDAIRNSIKEPMTKNPSVYLREKNNSGRTVVVFESTCRGNTNTVSATELDGKFPKCEDVIPTYDVGKDAVEIGVNPKLLGETLLAMSKAVFNLEKTAVRLIVPNDPKKPILILSQDGDYGVKGTAVVMPVSLA